MSGSPASLNRRRSVRVLLTGAAGFVGRALAQSLLSEHSPLKVEELVAMDQRLDPLDASWLADPRVRSVQGDMASPALLAEALSAPPELVFHLASVPGSLAEREPALGERVNLRASLDLLLALNGRPPHEVPRVVFASSVAVYGSLAAVDEGTPPQPALSYGAHKLMTEVLLADLSRRGGLDGVSLRLPGIVARPLSPTGHGSAFMSDLIRRLGAGETYTCPVGPQATAWWMSLPCCIDNLLHAAGIPADRLPVARVVQLPVLTATVAQLVHTIEARAGSGRAEVRYEVNEEIERHFGQCPPLHTPVARELGFVDDGDLATLVARATA